MRTLAVDAEYSPQDALAESSVFAVADPAAAETDELADPFDEDVEPAEDVTVEVEPLESSGLERQVEAEEASGTADLVRLYLKQMATSSLLTREGEVEIAKRIEVLRDGVTGRLVPARDPGALAAALLDLIGNEAKARAMGREARRDVSLRFSQERMVRSYEALYRCLPRRPGASA